MNHIPSADWRPRIASTAIVLALLLSAAAPLTAAPAPVRKTYFTLFLGLDAPYAWQADCLSFTADQLCTLSGTCGTWERSEAAGQETAIRFAFAFEESGAQVEIDGQARIDDRGKASTLAGAARLTVGGKASNFGMTGRAISRKKCLDLRRQWDRQNPPPQPDQSAACLGRATFGAPGESDYRLPYATGKAFRVGQTYCVAGDTHGDQLAYDLMLPLDTPVLAARAGTVRAVRDDVADSTSDDDAGIHNHVYIEHADGTTAFYAHLRQNGARVTVGQQVAAGDEIAISGSSGTDAPLLHFGVYRTYPAAEGDDLPVNFSNADGPLDERRGLYQDVYYKAGRD